MTSQKEYKNWHSFGSRFDFAVRFFFKVVIFEGVSLNKIKSQKIRCRSWSAVPLQHYLLNEKSIRFHDTHFIEHLKSIPKMTK